MGLRKIKVPKCSGFCPHEDPQRHAGFVRIRNRVFEWYCCPNVGCLHIGEWPERHTVEGEDEIKEILALKVLAQILKGRTPLEGSCSSRPAHARSTIGLPRS